MESTPPKLTKLVPFLERICEEVYEKHPALHMSVFEKRPFGRNVFSVRCLMCGQLRLLDKKAMQDLINTFRAAGRNVGFMFPIQLGDEGIDE